MARAYTPKACKVAQESLKECKVLSVFSENKTQPSNLKSSIVCCILGAMPKFCSYALLMVTANTIILVTGSATCRADCNEVLAIIWPSKMNAINSSLEGSGILSANLDMAYQLTVILRATSASSLARHICREEEV